MLKKDCLVKGEAYFAYIRSAFLNISLNYLNEFAPPEPLLLLNKKFDDRHYGRVFIQRPLSSGFPGSCGT